MKTIVAIATPLGLGGIGIVRISGEDALQIANHIFAFANFGTDKKFGETPNLLCYGKIKTEEFNDNGYAVFFKAPKSFTGEDVVEFQAHGGTRILDGIVREAIKFGAYPAEKGEFTKRAFLNGKMSLADAEGVIDMINAESAAGVRAAYRLMDGDFGKQIAQNENELLDLASSLEASLDYPDEMEDEVLPQIAPTLQKVIAQISKMIESSKSGRIAKNGIKIALVGDANVGKSSLMNAILKKDRAIVTDIAGTTRDAVTESIEFKGVKFNLVDTAGIRESEDKIEQIGIEKAKNELKSADLVLFVKDSSKNQVEIDIQDLLKDKIVFVVNNKADKVNAKIERKGNEFSISAKNRDGVEMLLDGILEIYSKEGLESGDVVTSERHLASLIETKSLLENAKQSCDFGASTDLILVDLKQAIERLGEITGTTANEEIIDKIFSRFCVGK